jgi:hypothetical protein
MRKLASIQEILSIKPIEGADKIEVATILGWHVVVVKGQFKTGDLCVYVEIDSLLPEKPEFEFMRDRKFKVKTIKLRGQVSQGICFPMDILPAGKYGIGDDVSEIIGVIKYEDDADLPEVECETTQKRHSKIFDFMMRFEFFRKIFFKLHPRKKSYGDFPSMYVSKTDETRIQAMPQLLKEYECMEFSGTEKLDGMSVTFMAIRNKRHIDYLVCSRNRKAGEGSEYYNISNKYNLKEKLTDILITNDDLEFFAIQGEIVGGKIQGNRYKLPSTEMRVFNVKSNKYNLCYDDICYVCIKLGLTPVDEVFRGILPKTVDELVELSKGDSLLYPTKREGVVFRLSQEESTVSFKVINPDFLLEKEKKQK